MEDNKSDGKVKRVYSFVSKVKRDMNNTNNSKATNRDNIGTINSTRIPNNSSTLEDYSTSNGNVDNNNSPKGSNTSNIRPNGYNKTGRSNIGSSNGINIPKRFNFRRPSNLIPPQNNSNNDSGDESEESESRTAETRRNTVSDISGKIVKTKKAISFFSKYKYIIIGCCIAVVIVILFMFLVMAIELDGDDDFDGDTLSSDYDEITMNTNGSGNEELWWPIGSSEVTTSIDMDGDIIEFRSGNPIATTLTSGYKTDNRSNHAAIDISTGGDVYLIALADGEITYISDNRNDGYNEYPNDNFQCSAYGYNGMIQINIKYNNGYESRYLHLKSKSIPDYLKVGSKVYQGQVVGLMGNTGCSTGQHLHFEIVANNQKVNPLNYVSSDNSRPLQNGVNKKSEEILKDSYDREQEKPDSGLETPIGNDNKQTICLTFKDYGYPDTGVAALMVNIYHESSFNPKTVNELGCVGLVQWCFGRQANIKSKYGSDWILINNQLEHIQNELITGYKYVYSSLQGDGSTSEKTYYFCSKYEIPGDYYCRQRRDSNLNNEYYNYVKNGCK